MPPKGRLAYEIASRPLCDKNLHAEVTIVEIIIARSGEFGATWREMDALNIATDVERRRQGPERRLIPMRKENGSCVQC